MKHRGLSIVVLMALLVFCLDAQMVPRTRDLALKVIAALEKIEAEQAGPRARAGRTYDVSEDELNAFVAYRLVSDQEPFVKSCQLKLLSENRVEGRIVIDVSGQILASLLPSKVDLFFSAGVDTREGKIKINMDNLFMGAQRLSPAFIDTIIAVVSGLEGVKSTSLRDWYAIPYGIRRMETAPGRLILHY